jgi:hypothetical protein
VADRTFIGWWPGRTNREADRDCRKDGALCRADSRTVFPFPLLGGGLHFFVQRDRWTVFPFPLLGGGLHFFVQRDRWMVSPFPLLGGGLHFFVQRDRWTVFPFPLLGGGKHIFVQGDRCAVGWSCSNPSPLHPTMTRQDYYPVAISEQVLWLHQFAQTLVSCIGVLHLQEKHLREGIADALWLAYVVGPYRTELRRFAPAATRTIEHAQTGKGHDPLTLTPYLLPPLPEGVVPRPPGALKRLFNLVVMIKYARGYDKSIGRQLGILPREDTREFPVPTFKIRVAAGDPNQKVIIRYSRHGQSAVFIQCQVGDGDWDAGTISGRSVYEDTRPLLVPGQPELRRYRMRYWQGEPFGNWTDVVTVTVGP